MNSFYGVITYDARCTHGIKSRTFMEKAAIKKKQTPFYEQVGFKFKDESSKLLHLQRSLCGVENWSLRNKDQKYQKIFKMWFWKRTEIIWTGCVKNKEVLRTVKKENNILSTVKSRKANWSGQILRRNGLINTLLQGK